MHNNLQDQYDAIWAAAQPAFEKGAPSLDAHLPAKAGDRRRSATLLIRPSAVVAAHVGETLDRLKQLEPHQYYYQPQELHVTVLSLWTGVEQPEPFFAQMPIYRRAVDAALSGARAFAISFDGLTASPAAVLVQGFPAGPELNNLRDRLRNAISAAGLGHTLDGRYRISAAHMTAMRFCRPPENLPRFLAELRHLRRCQFGQTDVAEVQLVENDWYMSHERVSVLHNYPFML